MADNAPPRHHVTEEEFVERTTQRLEEYRKGHPETTLDDLKLSTGWFKPVIAFQNALHNSVDAETNAKLSEATQKFMASKFAPEAMDEFERESRALLANNDVVLRQFDDIFIANRASWAKMREYILSRERENQPDLLAACVMGKGPLVQGGISEPMG